MDQPTLATAHPRLRHARAAVAALTVMLSLAPALRAQDTAAAKPPGAGAYSDEQAERGNGVFGRTCVECHTRNDMSNADFRVKWNGRTVFDLFDQIRTTMPEATPGSMTPTEYADVTAYFLKLNGMPAGGMPMPADSTLRSIKIDIPAPPSGPASALALRSARMGLHPVLHSPRPRYRHAPITRRGS